MAVGWFLTSTISGGIIFANLKVNRVDRLKAYAKETAVGATIAGIDVRTAPRSITSQQRELFIRSLKDAPKGTVTIGFTADNGESHDFAIQLRDLLRQAGYTVPDFMIPFTTFGTPLIGAQFETRDKDHPPEFALPLQVCLEGIGVPALGANGSQDQGPDDLRLRVGLKPQPQ